MREISLSVAVFQPDAASTVQIAIAAERAGIDAVWLPAVPMAFDPLTLLGHDRRAHDRIAIGTGIVPTYPRHPALLVSQILAVAPFARDRLRIGVGISHPVHHRGDAGHSRSIRRSRTCASTWRSCAVCSSTGKVEFSGRYFNVRAQLAAPPDSACRSRSRRCARACSGSRARSPTARSAPGARSPTCSGTALPELARGARAAGRPRPPLVAQRARSCGAPTVRRCARPRGRRSACTCIAPAYVEMFRAAGFAIPPSRVPPDALIDALFVWGTPQQIADRLRAIRRAGVDELMVTLHPAREPEKEIAEALRRARQPEPRPAAAPPRPALKGDPP